MKSKITLIAFFLISHVVAAQWLGSTASSGTTYRAGDVILGGTAFIGSFSGERIMQLQGAAGAIMSLRTTNTANGLDVYLGTTWANLNLSSGTMYLSTGFASRIAILPNGNVGIGTSAPGTFRLAVEGKVGAREFHVTTTNPWPDYVFDPNYKLRPLAEVVQFIRNNKHLPEMPSASEVETVGHSLGEMDALLLKKVEELTLYIVQQNEEIQTLKNRFDQMQNNKRP